VHSIAAALLLKKEELHFFNDIAYYHVPFTHCPTGDDKRMELKCHCDPKDNFDWKGYSCEFCEMATFDCRTTATTHTDNRTQAHPAISISTAFRNQQATRKSRADRPVRHSSQAMDLSGGRREGRAPKTRIRRQSISILNRQFSPNRSGEKHATEQGVSSDGVYPYPWRLRCFPSL